MWLLIDVYLTSMLTHDLFSIEERIAPLMKKNTSIESQDSAIAIISHPNIQQSLVSPPTETARFCKICLEQEQRSFSLLEGLGGSEEKERQLIVPCECSGSIGYVHQQCIRRWIQRQFQKSGKKQINCQICKSQLYYRLRKSRYCKCACNSLVQISGCNLLSSIAELVLLAIMIMVLRYSIDFTESTLFKYVLIGLICILGIAFACTLGFIFFKAFVKTKKQISHIFSIEESEELGLREARPATCEDLTLKQTVSKIENQKRHIQVIQNIGNNSQMQHCPFMPINPSAPANQL